MKVLVISEDFRKDQYMLKPIISAMMKALGLQSGYTTPQFTPLKIA